MSVRQHKLLDVLLESKSLDFYAISAWLPIISAHIALVRMLTSDAKPFVYNYLRAKDMAMIL